MNTDSKDSKEQLTEDQQKALEYIKQGKSIFITGAAGTGKSTIINHLPIILPYKKITITSTTGVSALLIGGITIHSFSGIQIGNVPYEKIINNPYIKRKWFNTEILVIDEISMLSLEFFELIAKVGEGIYKNNLPFGGLQLIITGDFAQLPPVKDNVFCFESPIWNKVIQNTIYLTKIIRQSDPIFQNCLNEIRLGSISEENYKLLKNRITQVKSKNGIIPTIIFPLKVDVKRINDNNIKKLLDNNNDFIDYKCSFKLSIKVSEQQYKTYIDLINKCCIAEDNLKIVIGMQVMIIANIDIEQGIANGTRGIISSITNGLPEVLLLNNKKIILDYHCWEYYDKFNNIRVYKYQIPLIPAYAITIHKCQGATIDSCVIDAGKNIFEHGQIYTALSRVKDINRLYLLSFDAGKIICNQKVKNYYNSLLV